MRQTIRKFTTFEKPQIFDRQLKKRHRFSALNAKHYDTNYYNYLREESNQQVLDRLNDINKTFPVALELGSFNGDLYNLINSQPSMRSATGGCGGIEKLFQCDVARLLSNDVATNIDPEENLVQSYTLQCDEEFLPFAENSFDLVLSSLYLHWNNDLQGTLSSISSILKPDGAFIGSILGNNTLKELRTAFYFAEQERKNGMTNHTSPLASTADVAALMQANFQLPTVDIDTITVSYPNSFVLMEHLSRMGEGNATFNRVPSMDKDTLLSMAAIYQEMYGLEDGSVPATFEVIYVIGWKYHDSQQKPCARGSAQQSLKTLSKDMKS